MPTEKELEQGSTDGTTNTEADFPIVVIGASAGGFEVMKALVEKLPHPFPAAILIVWHISPSVTGILPQVFNKISQIYAANAYDGEPLVPNRIYVAPPDHHLLVEAGCVRVTKGPKEHRFRPAIDPLFRSAAYTYGKNVIGIILSGALDDGSSGLWTIKERGGIAVVQDPQEAEVSSMPRAALHAVRVDYKAMVGDMPAILNSIFKQLPLKTNHAMAEDKKTDVEVVISEEGSAFEAGVMKLGELSPFTCPECHGVLTAIKDGNLLRYRCHTGHAFSADSLLDAVTQNTEENMYDVIRGMEETIMLLNHLGDHIAELNNTSVAARYFQKAQEVTEKARVLRSLAIDNQHLSREKVESEPYPVQPLEVSKPPSV